MKPEYSIQDDLSTFEALLRIVERLRGPDGCPWDSEQTHQSLKRNLLEECYEVLEAIDFKQPTKLAEEMCDILVQLAFHTDIAAKNDQFTWENVFLQVNNFSLWFVAYITANLNSNNLLAITWLNSWFSIL